MNDDCTKEVRCVNENGISSMKPTSFEKCGSNQECTMDDGVRGCVCKDGFDMVDGECRGRYSS